MQHLFIHNDGRIQASEDIPESILLSHEQAAVIIINTSFGAYLDYNKDWQEIEVIPSPPVIKHKVKMGGRGSGKTVANMPKESLKHLSKVLGIDE